MFQALRIAVNDELASLEAGLAASLVLLRPGGRLAVISFHSLEDRIVKDFIRHEAKGDRFPPDLPVPAAMLTPRLRKVGKAIRPGPGELQSNPRARSAALRVAEALHA